MPAKSRLNDDALILPQATLFFSSWPGSSGVDAARCIPYSPRFRFTCNRWGTPMSRQCELTGTKPMTGHNVSHSQIKTKRRFLPNLLTVSLHSEALDQNFRMTIAAKALRTVDKLGGLDGFLAKAKLEQLSDKAAKIKRDIEKKQAEA